MTMLLNLRRDRGARSASRIAGDLCPSRASRRRQDRLPDRTRAVGQIGPPAFLMPFPAPPGRPGPDITSREAHPTKRRTRPAARSMSGTTSHPPRPWSHRSDRHPDQPTEDDDPGGRAGRVDGRRRRSRPCSSRASASRSSSAASASRWPRSPTCRCASSAATSTGSSAPTARASRPSSASSAGS